jgi:hypothetical protein
MVHVMYLPVINVRIKKTIALLQKTIVSKLSIYTLQICMLQVTTRVAIMLYCTSTAVLLDWQILIRSIGEALALHTTGVHYALRYQEWLRGDSRSIHFRLVVKIDYTYSRPSGLP